jgi:hypothetical protein
MPDALGALDGNHRVTALCFRHIALARTKDCVSRTAYAARSRLKD